MIPRLAKVPAPEPLHVSVPRRAARPRLRGAAQPHPCRPHGALDRQLDLPGLSPGDRLSGGHRGSRAHRDHCRRAALSRAQAGAARRRHRHQRSITDRWPRRRPVAQHEPHPGDRPRAAARSGPVRGGEGSAQQGAGAARAVLCAGAVDLEPRHHRRHDQHRCMRPGLLHLRQDQPPCAGAHHRAARRHGLDLAPAGRGGTQGCRGPNRPRRGHPPAGQRHPSATTRR